MLDVSGIKSLHLHRFGRNPALFSAPGRVNLIGEHTDYAEGFVMPVAIDFSTIAAVSGRDDGRIVLYSRNFDAEVSFDLASLPEKGNHQWFDYPMGVVLVLAQAGVSIPAMSLTLEGDVPIGAGLSSSASIEVATALAVLAAAGTEMAPEEVARLCQRAENTYVGASTGIMDQFIATCGAENHALLLDCRDLSFRLAPIPPDISLVICNTMVKHTHAGGEYNTRRAEVEEATAIIRRHRPGVRVLRDATVDDLKEYGPEMPPNVLKRARHIITDSQRAVAAAEALERGDLATLGRLMAEAHASYRDDFEASCPEADLMVNLANQQKGLIGARLTGGGFGGCTVNLVRATDVEEFSRNVRTGYEQRTGIQPEIYRCHASAAAHRL